MMVVIFEVVPVAGRAGEYFELAKELAAELERIDGFIAVERFQSLSDPSRYLSLSTWRDEAAVAAWRRQLDHRAAQAKGKSGIFKDFRIRVAQVIRDYDLAAARARDATALR